MSRKSLTIDKGVLVNAMNQVKKEGKFRGLTEFYSLVAQHPLVVDATGKVVSSTWVVGRAAFYGIDPGIERIKREGPPPEALEKARATRSKGKSKKNLICQDDWESAIIRTENIIGPARSKKVITGSKSAAITAKCLQCCNGDRVSIKECEVYDCPLWLHRPGCI
jgi:ribosomal protein S17